MPAFFLGLLTGALLAAAVGAAFFRSYSRTKHRHFQMACQKLDSEQLAALYYELLLEPTT